ncbi:uncharacterized protein I303_108301 [Kwoniella dejecticola CBS 10117]|uniref:Uncharacterized protein n=1 Tax=Kwoniella dejecticola CBS 10117 TaxID=1296121 RepID=A0A1A5ZXS9_9TREE|nr:uncharacterized protein I303_07372 [Kwoniella dejecticola CBS 10117]OBR82610.1 hypothetical protein I303_07372 [Kwoniella dejecticola CBS 10117]
MADKPLKIPFLLDPLLPSSTPDQSLPIKPTRIASWIIPSCSEAGPSRRTALACADNTIWIHTSSERASTSVSREDILSPGVGLPSITTQAASSPTSPQIGARRSRPTRSRNLSYSGRPRNASSASSIYSTTSTSGSGSGRNNNSRRTSAFSPPPSALQLPTTTLSSVSASVAAPDKHAHRGSLSDKNDLRESLEKHKERKDDGPSVIGLGIGGITRKGLVGLHGRDEGPSQNMDEKSGATSPKSFMSTNSESTTSTARFGFFGRNSTSTDADNDDEKDRNEERIEEAKVELEMEKEAREDKRELQDRKLIEDVIQNRSPTPTPTISGQFQGDTAGEENKSALEKGKDFVRRIVMREAGRGKIVQMKVFEEIESLVILRDEGLLDIISLATLDQTASVDLESPAEIPSSGAGSASKSRKISLFWSWQGIHIARKADGFMLVAHGLPWPCALPSPNGEVTRVVMVSSSMNPKASLDIVARLELPGEGDVAICNAQNSSYLLHCTPTSFTSYPIVFPNPSAVSTASAPSPAMKASPQARAVSSIFPSPLMRSSTPDPAQQRIRESPNPQATIRRSASYTHLKESSSSPLLGIDHPKEEKKEGFAKFLARRDWRGKGREEDKPDEPQPGIGEGKEIERDGGGGWSRIIVHNDGEGAGWGHDHVDLFWTDGKQLQLRGAIALLLETQIHQVTFSNQWRDFIVATKDCTFVYRPTEGKSSKSDLAGLQFNGAPHLSVDGTSDAFLDAASHLLTIHQEEVKVYSLANKDVEARSLLRLSSASDNSQVTNIVPANVEKIFTADPQGNISFSNLASLLSKTRADSNKNDEPTVDRLDSPVTCMATVSVDDDTPDYLVAGDEDGVVRIWTLHPFTICGSWTLFADPVSKIAVLDLPQAGPLRGCLLITSREGTVGIISLKEMNHLFLIPASRTPLRRIFIQEKDIMLAYANGKARLWNTQTQEFRRSTGLDAAEDMLQNGDWAEVAFLKQGEGNVLSPLESIPCETEDLGRMLYLDLREIGRWIHSAKNDPNHSPLSTLRNLLSIFLTFGVDEKVDETCTKELGIVKPEIPIIIGQSQESSSQYTHAHGLDAWCISPMMTGLRQLVLVTLLRPFLDSPDHERWAAEVIAFYTASLPSSAIEPDLQFFAQYYMDSSSDVHQAARLLFAARLGRMSSGGISALIESGHEDLPSKSAANMRSSDVAINALTMLGGIALHKVETMQPGVLKSIAESVTLYLESTTFAQLALAVEICSKGFTTWQSYVDPFELLRRLFHLSTHKDFSTTPANGGSSIAAQARLAVLNVALTNPALFMSTLSMDILNSKTVEARTSIMKLCIFISRKKPNLLEHGLPKIAEAIVKSLDPNIGKMRDDVWQAATVILNELVLAFSTIAFHSGTQRLAVGTHEGAVIMYDLKTASRLYVIEPHKHPVSAVTFSPDGRRLITVSLEEGNVTVWKVGSSLSGFFNVGAPPRQGGEKGEPFKRIEFIRADDGPMSSTSALSDIQISWPGNRQARVLIKETALTFET